MARVRTVLGDIPSGELGVTMSHEHVAIDGSGLFLEHPDEDTPSDFLELVDTAVNAGQYRILAERPYLSRDNLMMADALVAIKELWRYKDAGGQSIIDVTPDRQNGRDPEALAAISEGSGINIVASTGWYIAESHPAELDEADIGELTGILLADIESGINGTDIRAGVIGELGCTEPLHPDEEKVLRAGARAQQQTGVPLTVHPMLYAKKAHRYIDILEEDGADLARVYISHMDASCPDVAYQESVMDRGVSINYDLFRGVPASDTHRRFGGDHWVHDGERIDTLAQLCANGYDRQIMVAHDVCLKMHWVEYGGKGYGYILRDIVPQLEERGVTQDQLDNILVENPKRMFAV